MNIIKRILLTKQIKNDVHNSIPTPITHQEELDRRLERYSKGETTFVSWTDIKSKLNAAK